MNEKITKLEYTSSVEYTNEKNETHNINDEPAIVWKDGRKEWYRNGKLHRTKGPAVINSNGGNYWFYEDNHITGKVNQLMDEGRISSDWHNWTEEDEFLYVLLFS